MLFTAHVADVSNPQQWVVEHLAFVRYYSEVKSNKQNVSNLTVRHLQWEKRLLGKGRQLVPSYGIVEVGSIIKIVCICPHFALWRGGCPQDFLVNDLLDLWPDLKHMPVAAGQDRVSTNEPKQVAQCGSRKRSRHN